MPTTNPKVDIDVANFVRILPLTERSIRKITRTVWQGEKAPPAELSIAIVGDKRMADMTEQYTHRRYRTDVLAFELSDPTDRCLVAQIVLNSQLARHLARRLKIDPKAELALYLIHGLLHLTGYDDHNNNDALKMHRQALKYLKKAGFTVTPPLKNLRPTA